MKKELVVVSFVRSNMLGTTARCIAAAIVGSALASCGGGTSTSALPALPSGGTVVSISPAPTPSPTVSPAPSPTLGAACTVAATPGTYTAITSVGNVTANAYAQSAGTWNAVLYATATPAPVPTTTPAPTPPPVPTPTPVPVSYVVYAGTYAIPGFTGTGSHGAYATSATSGCLFLVTRADGLPIVPLPPANAVVAGSVLVAASDSASPVANGSIPAFSITGLGPSSGTAAFTLDNGTVGSGTIESSRVVTADVARRMLDEQHRTSPGSAKRLRL